MKLIEQMQRECGRVPDHYNTYIEACAAVGDRALVEVTQGMGAVGDVLDELRSAENRFAPFHSAHEGIAVLREEYLELEQEVFWGKDPAAMREEAVQTAAMALRFIQDVCDCAR